MAIEMIRKCIFTYKKKLILFTPFIPNSIFLLFINLNQFSVFTLFYLLFIYFCLFSLSLSVSSFSLVCFVQCMQSRKPSFLLFYFDKEISLFSWCEWQNIRWTKWIFATTRNRRLRFVSRHKNDKTRTRQN